MTRLAVLRRVDGRAVRVRADRRVHAGLDTLSPRPRARDRPAAPGMGGRHDRGRLRRDGGRSASHRASRSRPAGLHRDRRLPVPPAGHFTSYLAAAHAIAGDLDTADTIAREGIAWASRWGFSGQPGARVVCAASSRRLGRITRRRSAGSETPPPTSARESSGFSSRGPSSISPTSWTPAGATPRRGLARAGVGSRPGATRTGFAGPMSRSLVWPRPAARDSATCEKSVAAAKTPHSTIARDGPSSSPRGGDRMPSCSRSPSAPAS